MTALPDHFESSASAMAAQLKRSEHPEGIVVPHGLRKKSIKWNTIEGAFWRGPDKGHFEDSEPKSV